MFGLAISVWTYLTRAGMRASAILQRTWDTSCDETFGDDLP